MRGWLYNNHTEDVSRPHCFACSELLPYTSVTVSLSLVSNSVNLSEKLDSFQICQLFSKAPGMTGATGCEGINQSILYSNSDDKNVNKRLTLSGKSLMDKKQYSSTCNYNPCTCAFVCNYILLCGYCMIPLNVTHNR